MTCAEFQQVLPYIIEGGGTEEQEAHLRSCPVCSDLVHDLRYIAEQAKLLVPMKDPHPRVWENIQRSLEVERAHSPHRLARPNPVTKSHPTVWKGLGWAAAAAAMLLFAFMLLRPSTTDRPVTTAGVQPAPAAEGVDSDDVRLLELVAQRRPELRPTYETSLKQVNAYIAEAKKTVEKNPNDDLARDQLMQAYEQKSMLYQFAMDQPAE